MYGIFLQIEAKLSPKNDLRGEEEEVYCNHVIPNYKQNFILQFSTFSRKTLTARI